jgi:Type II/IV secretion system protein
VLVIEDTAEIQLSQENLVRFEARREQNGLPAVAIRDLLKAALRHRPDRIVLGEVRGGEAFDLLQLLNTGHSGTLCTIHANSAQQGLARFTSCVLQSGVDLPYRAIKTNIADSLNVVVHVERRPGHRYISEVLLINNYESLLHNLANKFGGDLAATDSTRVLRLPRFPDHKLPEEFIVQARQESDTVYTLRDFTIDEDSPEAPRRFGEPQERRQTVPNDHKSQSERDWAYAKRALACGDDPEVVIQGIADYRADDKADSNYYARRTVTGAASSGLSSQVVTPRSDDAQVGREAATQDNAPRSKKLAKERTESERVTRERAEAKQFAAKKAKRERVKREKAKAERLAKAKAMRAARARAKTRMLREKAERLAKAKAKRAAQARAQRRLLEEAEQARRGAVEKAEAERVAHSPDRDQFEEEDELSRLEEEEEEGT